MKVRSCAVLGMLLLGLSSAHASDRPSQGSEMATVVGDNGSCTRPTYPERARKQKQEGTVKLRYLLGTDGKVKQTVLTSSSGHRALDEAAKDAISACSFAPPAVEGKQVERWTHVQYVFQLSAKGSSGSSGGTMFIMMVPMMVALAVARRRRSERGAAAASAKDT